MRLARFLVLFAAGFGPGLVRAHDHLNAGAVSQAQGAALYFVNGGVYAPATGYAVPLPPIAAGPLAGRWGNSAFTLTALWATPDFGPVPPNPPAVGSFIRVRVVSVAGPAGGVFSFVEGDGQTPSFDVPVGVTNGTASFELSENYDMEPDSDPFGHLHGRSLVVNRPGRYTLGLQLFDASPNGAGGGPIHAPSAVYFLQLWAGGPEPVPVAAGTNVVVTFQARAGRFVTLESSDSLSGTNAWQAVWGPSAGDDRVRSVTNAWTVEPRRFFRVREAFP